MSKLLRNRIFLIDDNQTESMLLTFAIDESERNIDLEAFTDSKKALVELEKRCMAEEDIPNLILLDLNMPGLNGIEVLKLLRKVEHTKYIPVILMTSSSLDTDTKKALAAGANSVIVKPTGQEKYVKVVQMIYDYWFLTVNRIDSGYY